jgi:hypothetical protein
VRRFRAVLFFFFSARALRPRPEDPDFFLAKTALEKQRQKTMKNMNTKRGDLGVGNFKVIRAYYLS